MIAAARAAILPLPAASNPFANCSPVGAEPTVVRAVRALLGAVHPTRVAVVVAEPFLDGVRGALRAGGCADVALLPMPAAGARSDAVAVGIDALAAAPNGPSYVVVHDVAHPLVPAEVTARVFAALATGHRVVVPVIPVTDSVKSVDERGAVTATVDRTALLSAQYPRGYAVATLRELGSDDVAAALAADIPIATVDGHPDGLRFTLPRDASLLRAIVESRG